MDEQDIFFSDDKNPQQPDQSERRARLGTLAQRDALFNPRYSKFIRQMRLILPLVAVAIVVAVFAYSTTQVEKIAPVSGPAPRTVGKNELLAPRFESRDEKNQPYTITAKRALQGEEDDDMVMLDSPVADIMLESGNWAALQARQGAFRQSTQKLLLKGDVRLFHDSGYQMETAQLHIDLAGGLAWSEDPVSGQGPGGTLNAKGLRAETAKELLVFTGPAKLVLHTGGQNGIGEIFHE